MNEKLLHFIWKYRLFNSGNLETTEGEPIEIIQSGLYNTDAGPDFLNAKIRIGQTIWAGNIELHIQSSDWFLHQHDLNQSYNNVILHVVHQINGPQATRANGELLPTLALKNHMNEKTLSRYEELQKNKQWIPCSHHFREADAFTRDSFLERLATERLETKVEAVNNLLHQCQNDWENVMFQTIAGYLGTSINKQPFLQLAQSLPVNLWAKYQSDKIQMEALVFGQAGLLEQNYEDEHPNQLRKEYQYLKRLHQLEPFPKHIWKFLRLRPSNFPTIRLAQLAALMSKEVKLFAVILSAQNVQDIHRFLNLEVSEYWQQHYQFDKYSAKVNSHLGDTMKNVLLINAVAPVLFAYGKYKDDEIYCTRAEQLLETCAPESNSIIDGWSHLNLKASNASQTQSLLQLKKEYCDKFKCLDCGIGVSILK
ncbi:MAG: DUF2851 family protein [Chitinophagales bacterium]